MTGIGLRRIEECSLEERLAVSVRRLLALCEGEDIALGAGFIMRQARENILEFYLNHDEAKVKIS